MVSHVGILLVQRDDIVQVDDEHDLQDKVLKCWGTKVFESLLHKNPFRKHGMYSYISIHQLCDIDICSYAGKHVGI